MEKIDMFLLILNTIGSYSISKTQGSKKFRGRQKTCQGDAIASSTDNQTGYSSSAYKRGAKRLCDRSQ